MTTDDLRTVAQRIVERMIRQHPAEAAVLASLVLSEILALGLFCKPTVRRSGAAAVPIQRRSVSDA